jgi:hypothetical protein
MPIPTYRIRISLDIPKNIIRHSGIISEVHIPKTLFENLPAQAPKSTVARSALSQSKKDYRHGALRLDWIDLDDETPVSSSPVMRTLISGKDKEERGRGTYIFGVVRSRIMSTECAQSPQVQHSYPIPINLDQQICLMGSSTSTDRRSNLPFLNLPPPPPMTSPSMAK